MDNKEREKSALGRFEIIAKRYIYGTEAERQVILGFLNENEKETFLSATGLYSIWCGMKTRCYNQKSLEYSNYGGRGIKVCDEWKNDFKAFYNWAMSNGYEDSLTIDRINPFANYEPSNCRWATYEEQAANKRKNYKE